MAIAAPPEYLLGRRELISFSDAEAVYGTAIARKELLGRNATFTPDKDSKNFLEVKGSGTDSMETTVQEEQYESFGGTLRFAPQDWKFLKHVLTDGTDGSVTDTSGGAYYTHTFQIDPTLGSFTLERARQHTTDHVNVYEGCQVDNFTLSFDSTGADGFVFASAEINAEDCNESSTTTSLAAAATEAFKPRMTTFTINGVAYAEVLRGSLRIEQNTTDCRYCNYATNLLKKQSVPQWRKIIGQVTLNHTSNAFWTLFDAGTAIASTTSIALTRGSNDSMTFTLQNVYLQTAHDPTNLDGLNEITLVFNGGLSAAVAVDAQSDYNAFT